MSRGLSVLIQLEKSASIGEERGFLGTHDNDVEVVLPGGVPGVDVFQQVVHDVDCVGAIAVGHQEQPLSSAAKPVQGVGEFRFLLNVVCQIGSDSLLE